MTTGRINQILALGLARTPEGDRSHPKHALFFFHHHSLMVRPRAIGVRPHTTEPPSVLVWPPPFGPAQPADSHNWFVRGASVRSQADTQSTAHSLRTERSRDGAHVGVGARSDGRPPSGPRGLLSVSNLSHSPCGSSGHRCLFGPAGARVTGPCLRGDLAWPVKARRSGIREDLSTPPPPQEPSRKVRPPSGSGLSVRTLRALWGPSSHLQ